MMDEGHKDLFSKQAKIYVRYRPTYPTDLFEYLLQFVEKRDCAWDCATGNGQAAVALADYFKRVEATDLSKGQIDNAVQKDNITYSVTPAENTGFPDNHFDLITVAQAYHWLNHEKFYREATRVGKNNSVVAIWMYNLFTSDNENLNRLLKRFYFDIVGPYWDAERKYVDEKYETVDFRFEPLPPKTFETKLLWQKDDFTGYLRSWSAVQHFINEKKVTPISLIENELDEIWKQGEEIEVRFPIYLKAGRIRKN